MTAVRQSTAQQELLHWLLVIATAMALTFLVAKALSSADPMREPRLLPDNMGQFAKPMAPEIVKPFFPESPPVRQLPPAEAAVRLWTILEYHRAGQGLEAIDEWTQVGLSEETAHWREIAMGAAYLKIGDLDRAAFHLDAAQQWMPGHPMAHYFTGLLMLEQAATAVRVPDGLRRGDLLVSYTPTEDRAVYRMMAIGELELAIARAHEVRRDERLVRSEPLVDEELLAPTAGDLVKALGADNFVGKAHNTLFGLRLDGGELAVAEYHLARAVETGIAPLYGYRDLAKAYLLAEEQGAAIRVGLKDLELNCPGAGRFIQWMFRSDQPSESWVW
jgi:hypothetical protein